MVNKIQTLFTAIRTNSQDKRIRSFFYIGVMLFSVVFIGLIIYLNWQTLTEQSFQFDVVYLIVSVICFGPAMLTTSYAWHKLLYSMGLELPFSDNLRIYSLSALPRHVPGLVLYLTSRTLLYEEIGVKASFSVVASAAEVLFFSLTGFIVALGLLIFGLGTLSNSFTISLVAIVSIIILLTILILGPYSTRLLRIVFRNKNIQLLELQRGRFFIAIMWMMVAWAVGGIDMFLFANAIVPLQWSQLPILISIGAASGAMSMSLGAIIQGFGIREVTLVALLSMIISPLFALIIAVGYRIFFNISELIWVGFFLGIIKGLPGKKAGSPFRVKK